MSSPSNRSDCPDDVDREDPEPEHLQLPSFRGLPPRLRPRLTETQPPEVSQSTPRIAQLTPAPASLLQPSDVEAAKERVKALMARMERRTLDDALEIGREALRVSRALTHGEIGRWLKETFGERRARSIYNWISLAEYAEVHPDEFASFSILDLSAVYLLTAAKTPRTAVEAIVRELEAGSIPTVRTVRAEISLAKKHAKPGDACAATRRDFREVCIFQSDAQELVRGDRSAAARADDLCANGLAALHAVARLIPRDDRERAIGWLRKAALAHCGLHDLVRSLSDATDQDSAQQAT